jgi:cytidylate kinase
LLLIRIAIDGPAGAGKSTIAKLISKSLGIIYLDTDAMYRAVALKAIESGVDTHDWKNLETMIENIDIRIDYDGAEQKIYLDGSEVSSLIRTPEISRGASDVAVVPAVRLKMVELQRKIADINSVVMDGRDIGSYVLPNAEFKFFLTASVDERARRRYEEQLLKGSLATYEEVRKDIEYRDNNDSSREFAPLCKAVDAVEVDTTNLNIEQVAEKILSYMGR